MNLGFVCSSLMVTAQKANVCSHGTPCLYWRINFLSNRGTHEKSEKLQGCEVLTIKIISLEYPLPFKLPIFSETLVFPCTFYYSVLVYFIQKWFWQKEILSFLPQRIYFVFLKQRDYLINLLRNRCFMTNIMNYILQTQLVKIVL